MQNTINEISVEPTTLNRLKQMVLDITQSKITPAQISDTADLFNDCGLDSTSVLELVISIEDNFNIGVQEDELDVALFQNLSNLAAFIEAKREMEV